MPVFFFDIQDQDGLTLDDDGCEFGCLDEARDEAIRFLPELARTVFPFGGGYDLAVKVRDEKGSCAYALTLSLVTERLSQSPEPDLAAESRAPKSRRVPGARGEPHQVVIHPVVAGDAAVGRLAARLSTQYFLRTSQAVSQHAGGDLVTGLVLRAVTAGNTGHLDQDPDTSGQFASLDDIPPDSDRRPVSVSAVAALLGLPDQTTRRHINKLTKAGLCIKVRGGVVAPSAKMRGPWEHQAMLANMASLRRMYRALKRAGANFD